MIGVEVLQELVNTILWTGHIKGESSLSALIAAPVEAGKTAIVAPSMIQNGILYTNSATAHIIIKEHGRELMEGKIKHIVIPDILVPMAKSTNTRNDLVMFLSALIEEGILKIKVNTLLQPDY